MTTYFVLTVIADDKPGLVKMLANAIESNSANWLESSMSQLAGKFAGLLRISVEEEQADKLEAALNSLEGLKLVIERVVNEATHGSPVTVDFSLVANDRPGIISEISHVLAELSVNVEKLVSHCEPAPMSGEQLFKASAKVKIPSSLDLDKLQVALENLTDDTMVEFG
ncbi:MAG: glycine cleavage system protein R [Pseudohongiellaceae bacterium]